MCISWSKNILSDSNLFFYLCHIRQSTTFDYNSLLDCMNEKPYNLFKKNEFKVYDKVRIAGNAAAHPGTLRDGVPFHYTEEQLRYIMNDFNEAMRYLDSHAHK